MTERKAKREPVPIVEAIKWYRWLGNWRLVALYVRRRNGSAFRPLSIQAAVRRYDRRAA